MPSSQRNAVAVTPILRCYHRKRANWWFQAVFRLRWPSTIGLHILAAMSDHHAGNVFDAAARKLRRAGTLSIGELVEVVRAYYWIALIRVGVRVLAYPTLIERLEKGYIKERDHRLQAGLRVELLAGPPRDSFGSDREPAKSLPPATLRRIVTAVDIAARNTWPSPKCLTRSLVLQRMLRGVGIPAEVRIGVARPDDGFEAHAWVEIDGRVINDAPDIAKRFSPLERAADLARLRLRDVASLDLDRHIRPMESRT